MSDSRSTPSSSSPASGLRIVVPRKHLPSFTLALSILPEDDILHHFEEYQSLETPVRNLFLSHQPLNSSDFMRTMDHRFEIQKPMGSVFSLPSTVFGRERSLDWDDASSDIETEVDEYEYEDRLSIDTESTYDAGEYTPASTFFKRLVWRIRRRCPHCGEKLSEPVKDVDSDEASSSSSSSTLSELKKPSLARLSHLKRIRTPVRWRLK
ncbi:hypothetical protein CC1G_10675 [Coprinopsis cinerea okayama7|uniref:Uncharacterized protein n=1 Tax=Coprinopsis cinerea (strain Okayama-7 / 130 / ATCC MYA-4618 / FGSC 9003) TaxID=240176 RepID=A8NDP9_COPC7|nr:hypothetical protein CC1G_10675 [Coprinopsis cinerea okayama7\|eukprot:XP_001832826.2 hypothetical protein CC1G_10675 [Coprinopsis cinerea okayama7\